MSSPDPSNPSTELSAARKSVRTLRLSRPLGLLAVWWVLSACGAPATSAADVGVGTIQGRVQNAVTGQHLANARVAVQGTTRVDFTDESGTYRIAGVPAGAAILEVFHTGLDPVRVTVQVTSGVIVVQDVGLTNAARFGGGRETVTLDPFVVSTARDTNAESIAINEQRFAPNLKNVITTEAFGDVTDGNVGEFLKFLPGITTDTDVNEGGTVNTVALRGFPANLTNVSSDGSQLANTGSGMGNTRTFYFGQVSTNNLARVEVTKAPTPATPADTMAGSVNLVSKSAFERKDARFTYGISLAASSQNLGLQREPLVNDKMIYKVRPGLNFDYTLPVNRDFGLVVTGQHMDRYVDQEVNTLTYATVAAAGASLRNPFLQQVRFLEGPRITTRQSLNLRADWRVTPNGVLTAGFQTSSFFNHRPPVTFVVNTGTNPTPTIATGQPLRFGPDYSRGATGRGVVTMGGGADFQQLGRTRAAHLRHRFDDGVWKTEVVADFSISNNAGRDTLASPGRFRNLDAVFNIPVRVELADPGEVGPRTIRVFDNADRELSLFDLRNYRLNTATSTNRTFTDEFAGGKVDLQRRFRFLPFPFALQAGGAVREQARDVRRYSEAWSYTGPADLSNLVHTRFGTRADPRFKQIPWLSTARAWAAYQADPSLFTQTPAQLVSAEQFRVQNSEYIKERVSAGYVQAEFRPWPALSVLGGVRREATQVEGLGPLFDPTAVWLRSADGSFARTPAGARIRRPEAGAAGSLEELALVRQERGFRARRSYDGYYPSLHLTYEVQANLLLRASWARTYGRPDFTEIIPNTIINELDTSGDPALLDGRINVRNPGLRPWSADNYDISLEFYTPQGGLLSVGAFRKNISGFFADTARIATAQDLQDLELDPRYVGWEIITRANAGNARTDGIEINLQHSLQPLGAWGRPFQVFVNGSKLSLSGSQRADFSGFAPETLNWGFNYNHPRGRLIARWNYRGERQQSVVAALGPNGAAYSEARTTLDLNVDLRVTPRLTLFANFNNVFGVSDRILRYGDETPAYARFTEDRNNGTLLTFGLKGTF